MVCKPCGDGLHDECDDNQHEIRSCPCLHRSSKGAWIDPSLRREVSE